MSLPKVSFEQILAILVWQGLRFGFRRIVHSFSLLVAFLERQPGLGLKDSLDFSRPGWLVIAVLDPEINGDCNCRQGHQAHKE